VLIVVSYLTRPPSVERISIFYGKMKTPIGETPELDAEAMHETLRNPGRFDHTKLLGARSSWEFTKWNREDTVGFLGCCGVSGAIVGLFIFLLRLAS
jgi:hypothetical protein